jgi:hypothetical protein
MNNNILITTLILSFILFITGAIVKNKTVKYFMFFMIALISFVGMFEMAKNISRTYYVPSGFQKNCPSYVFLVIAGFIYITLIVVIYNLLGLGNREDYRMLDINPVYKCVGGEYTWGSVDSPLYQFCSSPAVQEQLARINCGKGLVGRKPNWNGQWAYTSLSNNEWKNTTCSCLKNGNEKCNCLNKVNSNVGVL